MVTAIAPVNLKYIKPIWNGWRIHHTDYGGWWRKRKFWFRDSLRNETLDHRSLKNSITMSSSFLQLKKFQCVWVELVGIRDVIYISICKMLIRLFFPNLAIEFWTLFSRVNRFGLQISRWFRYCFAEKRNFVVK